MAAIEMMAIVLAMVTMLEIIVIDGENNDGCVAMRVFSSHNKGRCVPKAPTPCTMHLEHNL